VVHVLSVSADFVFESMRPLNTFLLLVALLASSPIRAEILIVTSNRSGPIELTRDQAEKLYLGRSSTFSDGTPASLVDLPNGPVRDEFYLKLTGKNPSQIQAYWSRLVFTGRAFPQGSPLWRKLGNG
jgi:hypothetical protein